MRLLAGFILFQTFLKHGKRLKKVESIRLICLEYTFFHVFLCLCIDTSFIKEPYFAI